MNTVGTFYLGYHLWHRSAYAVAQQLHAEHNFDLAHQINYTGYREPGFLYRLPIPFVWGPIGGTQNFPYRFLTMFGVRHAARELLRNVLNTVQLRTSVRVRQAARKASAVMAANSTNERDLQRACKLPITRMLETGVLNVTDSQPRVYSADRPFRILHSGLIEPHKGLPILLQALALLPDDFRWELRVTGIGSLSRFCRRSAIRLGIDHRIEWLGWISSHAEVLQMYSWADAFTFTSLRDTSGNVVLEALSNGVPVICLDHQGVADIVTPECGIKIPVSSPRRVIRDFAKALQLLAEDPAYRRRLSEEARRRATYFLWSRQGERMAEVYQQVLNSAGCGAELRERNVSARRSDSERGVLA